jgi:hypothetical protein
MRARSTGQGHTEAAQVPLRANSGWPKATDTTGRPIIIERLEKGVDILCALALIREASDPTSTW